MKVKFLLGILTIALVTACQTPSQKCSGTYNGQYTNNALILTGINTAVVAESDDKVSVTFDAGSGTSITVSGISVSTNGNDFTLIKTELFGAFSGAVSGNELNVGYSYIGGAITFVGTK